jgi:predicted signal transduction protein with EAL and GGDEF domain
VERKNPGNEVTAAAQLTEPQIDALLDERQRDNGIKELRRAIDEQQLLLHYQPKVNSRDGRIMGVEALIRWNHPERGTIAPGQFIPLLEDSGLILEVGAWVLRQAAADFLSWTQVGLAPAPAATPTSLTCGRGKIPHLVVAGRGMITRFDGPWQDDQPIL